MSAKTVRCWYCGVTTTPPPKFHGETPPGTTYAPTMRTKEHLRPKSAGGRSPGNIVWSCFRCNMFVGSWPRALKYRFRDVMRAAGGWEPIRRLLADGGEEARGSNRALRRLVEAQPERYLNRLPPEVAIAAGLRDEWE